MIHNVRLEKLEETRTKADLDPAEARLAVQMSGEWRVDAARPQFGGEVAFPQGSVLFEAEFPPFLGGEGRAPTPLAYCFYGAMCCYGATFATQAAMAGITLRGLSVSLSLAVDFRSALGMGEFDPLEPFVFEVSVETDASEEDVQRVKALADARCPAIWAMSNPVPYTTTATKRG